MSTPLLNLFDKCWDDKHTSGKEITSSESELKCILGLLQDIYDEGHGGEYRVSIQEILVRYKEFI